MDLDLQEPDKMLKCDCGGELEQKYTSPLEYVSKIAGPVPSHKNKRLRKKLLKRDYIKNKYLYLASILSCRPYYICEKCKKHEGFFSVIARNMIQMDPLPTPEGVNNIWHHD